MNARLSISGLTRKPIIWTTGQTQSSVQEDGSSCGVFVEMNAWAMTKNVPTQLMRQCHIQPSRQYALQQLLSEATTIEAKGATCDLPFCVTPDIQKHHSMSLCPSCEKWMHKLCLGVEEDQIVKTCIFCG